MVVGQNPSAREYINSHLSNISSIEGRRESQITYFKRRKYGYFNEIERFFEGEVKKRVNWKHSPWEKVGYLDLVKCPTTRPSGQGQWSKINRRHQKEIIKNCEGYLKEQLNLYKPTIILPYGFDVCKWFAKYLNVKYELFEDKKAQLSDRELYLLFIPQKQGPHSKPEILWIRKKILKIYEAIACAS